MNSQEVGELLTLLAGAYPNQLFAVDAWVNSFAQTDARIAMESAAVWVERRPAEWPTPADIHTIVRLRVEMRPRMRATAWAAYEAECKRQGREPTAPVFAAEIQERARVPRTPPTTLSGG